MTQAIANHLWQSSVFAVAAALLTLVLRRNAARYRYWVWMAASLKFLIPLSVLMSVGGHLAQKNTSATLTQPSSYYAMDVVSQPFTFPPVVTPAALSPRGTKYMEGLTRSLPGVLMTAWIAGFVAVLTLWWKRWRSVAAALRKAPEATDGREFEALRRLKPGNMRLRLAISEETLEPGVFGVFDPVLVWPRGFSEHLDYAQMEAILAHEISHVRRRDNLAAALHMAIEAVFWFHPIVWWLGKRLIEERERACDEAVVELGNQPRVYVESILKACTFCVESPLACVAGITGAGLKQRVVRIMTGGVAESLSLGRRVLFAAIGLGAVAGPAVFGLVNAPRMSAELLQAAPGQALPQFEVATVKPNKSGEGRRSQMMNLGKLEMQNIPLRDIISFAYDLKSSAQIDGAPGWINNEAFDITAKADEAGSAALDKMSQEERTRQLRLMLQGLLAERFGLKVSRETKELPVFALVVAKSGVKLTPSAPPVDGADGKPAKGRRGIGLSINATAEMNATSATMSQLANTLSHQREAASRPVVDKTGLTGEYNWTLKWAPENDKPTEDMGPTLFTALEEQLGLKLEPQKGSVDVLVIESVQRPTGN